MKERKTEKENKTMIKLTNIQALASTDRFDTSLGLTDTTHIRFCFAEYEVGWRNLPTGNQWEIVVPLDELLKMLCDWQESN